MPLTDRELDQRRRALQRGNATRIARAQLKARIAADFTYRTPIAVLRAPTDELEEPLVGMRVWDVVRAAPRCGEQRTRRLLRIADLHYRERTITLAELDARRRRILIGQFRSLAERFATEMVAA